MKKAKIVLLFIGVFVALGGITAIKSRPNVSMHIFLPAYVDGKYVCTVPATYAPGFSPRDIYLVYYTGSQNFPCPWPGYFTTVE